MKRRTVLAGLAAGVGASALAAQEGRVAGPARGAGPAEVIRDPRVGQFDIGPAQAPWRIFTALPRGTAPAGGWPAIFILDANAHFPAFWHRLAKVAPEAPLALVGIGYPVKTRFDGARRFFDMTSPALGASGGRATGGRDAFRDMITDQLPGQLQSVLPLDPGRRMLFGHSLGGLFGLHMLFTRPGQFRSLVLADPSAWWNAGAPLREAEAFAGGLRAGGGQMAQPVDLLITSSGSSPHARGEERQAYTAPLVARLSGLGGLSLAHRHFAGLTHGSLVAPSVAAAVERGLHMVN